MRQERRKKNKKTMTKYGENLMKILQCTKSLKAWESR